MNFGVRGRQRGICQGHWVRVDTVFKYAGEADGSRSLRSKDPWDLTFPVVFKSSSGWVGINIQHVHKVNSGDSLV